MKSRLIASLLLSIVLSSCDQKPSLKALHELSSPTESAAYLERIRYSNMVDKATQDEVKAALLAAGVRPSYIEDFLTDVIEFNTTVGEVGLVKQGFVSTDHLTPLYDQVKIQERWEAKNKDFIGHNCRLTTYGLMRDFITIDRPIHIDSQNLFVDEDALEHSPRSMFSPPEEKDFKAFFSQIPTVEGKDIARHIQVIKEDWQRKGISFIHKKDPTKASFISVFFHSYFGPEDNHLFIGHIGILAPYQKDSLIFIEKLSFHEPYQALLFKDRIALNDYLMNRYDREWDQPTAKPIIFENDALMEGYRPNPKNP